MEKLSFAYITLTFNQWWAEKSLIIAIYFTQIKNWLNYVVLRIKMEGKMREYSLLQLLTVGFYAEFLWIMGNSTPIFFDIYENYWNNATFFQQLWLLGLIQLLK